MLRFVFHRHERLRHPAPAAAKPTDRRERLLSSGGRGPGLRRNAGPGICHGLLGGRAAHAGHRRSRRARRLRCGRNHPHPCPAPDLALCRRERPAVDPRPIGPARARDQCLPKSSARHERSPPAPRRHLDRKGAGGRRAAHAGRAAGRTRTRAAQAFGAGARIRRHVCRTRRSPLQRPPAGDGSLPTR